MRISIVFLVVFSALAACSLAAPAVLERKARQTVPSSAANMNALITGLNLLSKNSVSQSIYMQVQASFVVKPPNNHYILVAQCKHAFLII